ncbi:unnamed protein product [Musa acuminata var. zebrina]
MKFLEYTPLDSINLFLDHLNLGESIIKGNLEAFSCKQTGTDRKLSFSLEQEILDYLEQSFDSDSHLPVEYLISRSSRKTLIYLVLTLSHMYPDYDFSAVRSHLYFREEEWDNFKQIYDMYLFEAARVCSCPCISFINWRWYSNGSMVALAMIITMMVMVGVVEAIFEQYNVVMGGGSGCNVIVKAEWATANGGSSFIDILTNAIDEVVKIKDCEIYSYNPDFDGDHPFLEKGAIWAFNFFFYNRKLKRVVSFRCCCFSKLAAEEFLGNNVLREEEEEEEEDLLDDMEI